MYKILSIKIEMSDKKTQKGAQYQENSLFSDQLIIQQLPFAQISYNKHKNIPSTRDHEEQCQYHPDTQNVLENPSPSQLRFYLEYKKIYTVSHHLALEKARQLAIMENLRERINSLEEKMKDTKERNPVKKDIISDQNRSKRSRRTAEEIQKKFKCQVACCQRLYGSEGSLQQHIKLKHPQLCQKSHNEDSNGPNQDSFL